MLSAGEFIFELGHLLLGAVQHGAEFVRDAQIGGAAVDFRATLQLRCEAVPATDQHLPQSSRGAGELFHRFGPEERKENVRS